MDFWIPESVEQLEGAIERGDVAEGKELECKAFEPDGRLPSKKIAESLAALSIDGGLLIVGVAEHDNKLALEPGDLSGAKESLANIALDAVRPPIRPAIREFTREDGKGYLVVTVAASSRAPHMVTQSHAYYGRVGARNERLDDTRVRQLWQLNLDRRDSLMDLLDAEVARDPLSADDSPHARLYAVAQPVSAHPTLLLDAVPDRRLRTWVSALASERLVKIDPHYSPSIAEAGTTHARAFGAARSGSDLQADRELPPGLERVPYNYLVDVEFREDGGIRWYNARASDTFQGVEQLFVKIIGGEASALVEAARVVSRQADFRGSWWFGLAVRGMKSTVPYRPGPSLTAPTPYDEHFYTEVFECDYATLNAPGSPVLEALVGRLVRTTMGPDFDLTTYDTFPVHRS